MPFSSVLARSRWSPLLLISLATVIEMSFLFLPGLACSPAPTPPAQKSVEQAWARSDQATQQVIEAQADVKHIARLRELDRLRYQADVNELSGQITTLRGIVGGLGFLAVATVFWLAVEIRRRRVLTLILDRLSRVDSCINSDNPPQTSLMTMP